ncbi:MAG TPA: ATP-binding protein [Tepidiformaceae bacterium]|nr:ATP-binding protein [Tepidiformaceae bacterium]
MDAVASKAPEQTYTEILREFVRAENEEALYQASLLSQQFISRGVLPDEIVAMHTAAVQEVVRPHDPRGLVASQQLLLEMMIAYGVKYAEYAEFRLAEARKAAEEEHNRVEEAERTEQERLELLAMISHELGTPLTVARGNVAAIRRFLAENNKLSDDLSSRAIDAEVAIDRLLARREELVAASRNERRGLELAPLDLHNAVTRAVKWAQGGAIDKGVMLSSGLDAEHSRVIGDPDALQSILGNLLSNAIRYTPAGGAVTVCTRNDHDQVVVEIADNGIGMSQEAQHHLFERFYRAAEAKQMASWGLGLGLAIAKELADALDATITAQSKQGQGTTFAVRFPLVPEEE